MSEAVTTVQTYLRGIVEKAMNDGDSTVTCSIAFLLTIADKFERLAAEHYTLLCAQEQNEPLTIEEIISMNGKPVWCQTGDGYEGWALVIVDNYQDGGHYLYLFSDELTRGGINEAFEPDEDFYNLTFSDDPNGHFGLHVLGWRAYRYEPKGADQ